MTEQFPGHGPEEFDAFRNPMSQPAPDFGSEPDPTMVFEPVPLRSESFLQRVGRFGKTKLAVAGIVAAALIGGGAWAASSAFASSDTSSSAPPTTPLSIAPPSSASPDPGTAAKKGGKSARITIAQVSDGSFTGTDVKGHNVTVTYSGSTRFGDKAHPLTSADLTPGMTVNVLGARTGDSMTATAVVIPTKKASGGKNGGGKKGTPTPPAAPVPSASASDTSGT